MKKNIILVTILLSCFLVSKGQLENCSTKEKIILDERPKWISERDAYDMMLGIKKETAVEVINGDKYTRKEDFPFSRFNVFKQIKTTSLNQIEGKTLPVWLTSIRYEYKETTESRHFKTLILFSILSFFFSLLIINLSTHLLWESFLEQKKAIINRSIILFLILVLSIILGTIVYRIGSSISEYRYEYIKREHIIDILSIFLSGVLWIIFIHIKERLKNY